LAADALRLSRGTFVLLHSGLMLAAMAGALWACVYWWRRTDEAAREAHKWAWFWGATVGLAALGVVLPQLIYTGAGVRLAGALAMTEDNHLVMFGLLLAVGVQLVGYTVAWTVWWLKRR
jgi:hypothetical protein